MTRALGKPGRRTLDDKIRAEDTHGGNTNTRLGSAVGGTQAGEDNGAGAAHGTKEGLCDELAGLFIISESQVFEGDVLARCRRGYLSVTSLVRMEQVVVTDRVDGAIRQSSQFSNTKTKC